MSESLDVPRLIHVLATHPVLPPAEVLPANDDELRAILADLARGGQSSHAAAVQSVSSALGVSVEEVSRRATFLLSCLSMPTSGTHYEVLGVARDATKREIRARWASLMQRYHPDHLGSAAPRGWLDDQVRRLTEAYRTLKDPDRRRAYDAQLAGPLAVIPPLASDRSRERTIRLGRPNRWRWMPLGIAAAGAVAGLWGLERTAREPLPHATLPAAPNLLDGRGTTSAESAPPAAPAPPQGRTAGAGARREELRPAAPIESEASPPRPASRSTASAPIARAAIRSGGSAVSPLPPAQSPRSVPSASSSAPAPLDTPVAATPPGPTVAESPSLPLVRSVPSAVAAPSDPAPNAVITPVTSRARAVDAPTRAETLLLIERFRAAYERRDLPAVMALLGSEPRDLDVSGRRAVEQLYVKNFAALEGIRYELINLDVTSPSASGDLVVEGRFRIRATLLADGARPMDVAGPIRWLLRREDGALRIAAVEYEAVAR
jgi:ketosteroid isomerase-like protein